MQCPTCKKAWPDEFKVCPMCGVPLSAQIGEGTSGALAQNHSAAASTKGVAVGGGVEGGIHVTEVHYHGTASTSAAAPHPKIYHNLPHPDYGQFVGREPELAKIHHLLLPYPRSRYYVIAIDGIGGIGKSSLALEAALRYVREPNSLPPDERFDAIIWASAKQTILTAEGIIARRAELRTLDDIYTTIAATLEREDIPQARSEDRPTVVARALARQRTLLIIDNLETITDEQVMAFIREVPEPTKIIVTTRQRLDVAFPVRLLQMPWQDAQQLIAQECDKESVTLTEEQAHKLHERTGGVPLALVWSIARVALGDEVDIVLRRLAHPGSDVARFCFEGVVQLLRDNETYTLLLAMALFAQDAPYKALGQIAGVEDELCCADGLITLERLSLLNKHQDRFSLLPLTRAYLQRELKQKDQFVQAGYERMLNYYRQLASPSENMRVGVPYWDGAVNYEMADTLKPEWGNLTHLLHWAMDQQYDEQALGLFLSIVHFLNTWGLWDERLHWGREMCRVSERLKDTSVAWLWIDAIGWILLERRLFSECIGALKTGKALAQQLNLDDAIMLADAYEARLYIVNGDAPLAALRLEIALNKIDMDSILVQGSRLHRIAATRVIQAAEELAQLKHDFIYVKELYQIELELRRSTGQRLTTTQARLGQIYLKLGDLESAEGIWGQGLVGAKPIDLARIHYGLALVAEQKSEWQQARRWCELAIEDFTQLEIERGIQEARQLLGRLDSISRGASLAAGE